MEVLGTVLLFLIVLSTLVVIHELGHFFAARLFGVHVEEFGIGFPPRAWGIVRGKTVYTINWLPLGGFVKLKGEQGESARDKDSFAAQPIWKRIIILSAGVVMNLVLAMVIIAAGLMIGMPQVLDDSIRGGTVKDIRIQILGVLPESPADSAGLQPGDEIRSLDGTNLDEVKKIQEYTRSHASQSIRIEIGRGDEVLVKEVTPTQLKNGNPGIGVELARTGTVSYPIFQAIALAVTSTFAMVGTIFALLFGAFRNLAFDGFVGPVGIAVVTSSVSKLGFTYLLGLVAQLSVSLAVFNILPLPALDGGRVFFALMEKARGRALRAEHENMIHVIGFLLLIGLLLLITYRDIVRLLTT